MHSRNRYLHRKPKLLIPHAAEIASTCRANASPDLWDIDPKPLAELEALVDRAQQAFKNNIEKNTKNHFTVVAQKTACADLHRALGLFMDYLISKKDTVPDAAIESLGIRPRRRVARSPLPPPADAPLLTLEITSSRAVTLYLSAPQFGHPTEFLAPLSYYAAHVQYKLEGAPEWEDLHLTRKKHTLLFDDTAVGKWLVARAAWLNPRLKSGPWSNVKRRVVS